MALKRSAAHIAFFSFVKGISCARRAAAMRERLPAPPREVWQVWCARKPVFLISRARQRPSHPLDGRETAVPPAEQARSAPRRRRGMQFASRTRTARPQARARRADRLRCADPIALRCPGRGFGSPGIAPVRCEFSQERITPHECNYGIVL